MTQSNQSLVLAGAGHAHLVAIRRWISDGYRPPAGTLLLSPTPQAWYSGMMPGLVAGRFAPEQCAIELAPLCQACGIALVIGTIAELDADSRVLRLDDGRELGYTHLSLNVGSVPPQPEHTDGSVLMVPAKPFAAFNRHWQAWRERSDTLRLAVLGGGPAAFELAVALRRSLPMAELTLICGGRLLEGQAAGVGKRARQLLNKRGIMLLQDTRIDRICDGFLMSGKRQVKTAGALVVATGAGPQPWQAPSGLACDDRGFVQVSATLQSRSHANVLASGDCASLPGAPHSGVYAVRQGSTLVDNIPALLQDRPLADYQPQPRALVLMATADGGALLSYGRWSGSGRLLGKWKDHLDLGFMQRHRL